MIIIYFFWVELLLIIGINLLRGRRYYLKDVFIDFSVDNYYKVVIFRFFWKLFFFDFWVYLVGNM